MGAAAGVGQGAVLAGAVVLGPVAADQLFPDADLDGVPVDGDLDLSASVAIADAIHILRTICGQYRALGSSRSASRPLTCTYVVAGQDSNLRPPAMSSVR